MSINSNWQLWQYLFHRAWLNHRLCQMFYRVCKHNRIMENLLTMPQELKMSHAYISTDITCSMEELRAHSTCSQHRLSDSIKESWLGLTKDQFLTCVGVLWLLCWQGTQRKTLCNIPSMAIHQLQPDIGFHPKIQEKPTKVLCDYQLHKINSCYCNI